MSEGGHIPTVLSTAAEYRVWTGLLTLYTFYIPSSNARISSGRLPKSFAVCFPISLSDIVIVMVHLLRTLWNERLLYPTYIQASELVTKKETCRLLELYGVIIHILLKLFLACFPKRPWGKVHETSEINLIQYAVSNFCSTLIQLKYTLLKAFWYVPELCTINILQHASHSIPFPVKL